ncbi:MAG: enoyl-CoA hydratase-related protein [Candidatus Sericytochromatia bacterium]|nr:enoyl-CoA hydratase-related protein [Candidatus Sericytochromatia bacterium]
MSQTSAILVSRENGVCTIVLNRPERMNAINRLLLRELRTAFRELWADDSVRAIVVTGSGEKAFCAGADLKERAEMTPNEVRLFLKEIRETMSEIENIPKPVIAAINGLALGGGTELALACDVRFAAEHAQMGLTETTLAIIPGAGGTQRLPRLVGKGRAKELIFSGRKVLAPEALQLGLIERFASSDQLLKAATDWARSVVDNTGPIAISQAKFAINRGLEVDLESGLALEAKAYEVTIPTTDRTEALRAFAEKRKPNYTGT